VVERQLPKLNVVSSSLITRFLKNINHSRRDFAPRNLALLRHLALNLLSQDTSAKRGIAARRKKAAWDQSYFINLLTQ
jgi:predicted transposase YbfD/YdcC